MVPKVRMWKNPVKSLVFLRKRKILIKFLIKFVLKKAKNFCYFLLAAKKFLLAEQLGFLLAALLANCLLVRVLPVLRSGDGRGTRLCVMTPVFVISSVSDDCEVNITLRFKSSVLFSVGLFVCSGLTDFFFCANMASTVFHWSPRSVCLSARLSVSTI